MKRIIAVMVVVLVILMAVAYFDVNVKVTLDGNNLCAEGGDKVWIDGEMTEYNDAFCVILEDGEHSITIFEDDKVIYGDVFTVPDNWTVYE